MKVVSYIYSGLIRVHNNEIREIYRYNDNDVFTVDTQYKVIYTFVKDDGETVVEVFDDNGDLNYLLEGEFEIIPE